MFSAVLEVVWFLLPAYVANSIAIDVKAFPVLKNYSAPVDGGRSFGGKRVLGDGKTWRGLLCGVVAGVSVGLLQMRLHPTSSINLIPMTLLLAFLLSLGALSGDMVASFFKRRWGLISGAHAPLLDQLDYILGAFLFSVVVVPFNLKYLLVALIITIPLHAGASVVAWILKLKKDPW